MCYGQARYCYDEDWLFKSKRHDIAELSQTIFTFDIRGHSHAQLKELYLRMNVALPGGANAERQFSCA